MIETRDIYSHYEDWKGWLDHLFEFTSDDAEYYAGETRDCSITGASVFEIGFGSGSFLAWAKMKGARVAGCEVIEVLIEAARNNGIEILPADFETVADAQAGRFDTVVAFDVLEHLSIQDLKTRIPAIAMLLKPGGRFVARFPNIQSPFGLVTQFGDPSHMSFLSAGILERIALGTGLTLERYSGQYRIYGRGMRRLVRGTRYAIRSMIERSLAWTYAHNTPLDQNAVALFRKS